MDVFCDRLKVGSTAALYCQTGKTKRRSYCEKEVLFLLFSLRVYHGVMDKMLFAILIYKQKLTCPSPDSTIGS